MRHILFFFVLLAASIPRATRGQVESEDAPSKPSQTEEVPTVTSIDIGERHRIRKARHGVFLINTEDTFVGRSLDMYGEWCQSEVVLFSKVVKEGDVVIDVGANIGAFSIPLANLVGPKGAIVAFEPQRQLFQLLSANVALNELSNAFVYQKAVGEGGGR